MEAFSFEAPEVAQGHPVGPDALLAGAKPPHAGRVAAIRYRICGLLGAGGMGLIYEAIHLALDTTVAIKVLRPELVEVDDHVACILNEARCLAALSSDHVVRIVDTGWLETGAPFLVMERLHGINLGVVVKACGRLAVSIAVEYALEACAGLAEAHSLQLIHCDIKPTNLFLAGRTRGVPRIKLIDFGIARWIGAAARGGAEAGSAAQHKLRGSPAYCSPEQLEGTIQLDERTDIWSLGLVLFEMLTGTSPYSRSSISEIRTRILLEPHPRVRSLRPELDRRLAATVDRCLARDRDCRFGSVQELSDALLPFASASHQQAFGKR